MFTKLFQKNSPRSPRAQPPPPEPEASPSPAGDQVKESRRSEILTKEDVEPRVTVHYGIPSTASILAFDPIQSLLAVGTLDGRIKVFGGDNIEGLLVSPKQQPFKYLQFLQNQGFLVSVTNENEIQVWDLEQRQIASTIQWESNLTAFAVITGSCYMYVGDEYGIVSVLKYDADQVKLVIAPYYVPTDSIAEASGTSSTDLPSVVGLLPQPSYQGNRLLIAYQDGVIVLWDASEDKVIEVKGNKDWQQKNTIIADGDEGSQHDLSDDGSENEQEEKEISSLCWISSDGSVLAVGYVDGDILFWNLSAVKSAKCHKSEKLSGVIKLQLSSSDRKLPVIVLHWSPSGSRHSCKGQLFVYGGDAIGSDEVLTVLRLDWSSGIESLECVGRLDLTLNGSFADMVLLTSVGTSEASGTIVLTNPGQLHFYDDHCLASVMSQKEKKNQVSSVQYPTVIPTMEPYLTTVKLGIVYNNGKLSRALYEKFYGSRMSAMQAPQSWPLRGGVPIKISSLETYQIERLYIAGYQDGSVRIWDVSRPDFSLFCVLEPEVKGIKLAGMSAPVSVMEFCSSTLTVAVGNDLGMVRLYNLIGSKTERSLTIVTDAKKEVLSHHQDDGPRCAAVFSLIKSSVCALHFANLGTRLAVGFKCGRVAMLDVGSLSVLFLIESLPGSSLPIKFIAQKSMSDRSLSDPVGTESKNVEADTMKESDAMKKLVVVTMDANFIVVDASTGTQISSQALQPEKNSIVITVHSSEPDYFTSGLSSDDVFQKNGAKTDSSQSVAHHGSVQAEVELETSSKVSTSGEGAEDSLLVLCCANALHSYSLKSLNEGDSKPISSINLQKTCCWTATFQKNDKEQGLIVLYETGVIEIRSLPNLEVVGENSLMAMLRWNFKNNMEKTLCSSHNAQMILVNGCECASLSLLVCENDLRIPEYLPCLHDKVLAAAADIPSSPPNQKGAAPHILSGIIKGFHAGKVEHDTDLPEASTNNLANLDNIFSSPPFLKPFMAFPGDENIIELDIDDIEIDGPVIVSSSTEISSSDMKGKETEIPSKGKETERDRLFEGATMDSKPKPRTAEEIRAKYRNEDPATAAARAREKLVERQEKLERLSLRTQELQNGAEDFASMANDLVKQMEKRKWWNI